MPNGRLITDNHPGFDVIEDDNQNIYTPHLPFAETERVYNELKEIEPPSRIRNPRIAAKPARLNSHLHTWILSASVCCDSCKACQWERDNSLAD